MAARRSRFAALEAYHALSPEAKERIDEEVEESNGFEEIAESTIKRREDTREELEIFWAVKHDDDLWAQPVDILAPTLKIWMTAKVEGTPPRGDRAAKGATHVTYNTLKAWRMNLVRLISKYVPDGQKKLNDSLYVSLTKHSGYLTVKHKLELLGSRKQFCGRNEVRLLTESMYARSTDREWTLQTDVMLKSLFMCGTRPGALGPASQRYLEEGKFPKWKDITINCEGFATYHTRIDYCALKGYNLIAAKRLTSNLRSAQRPANVIFDIAPPLLALALERGGIKGIKNIDALLESKKRKIEWEDWFLDEPVFCAGKIGGHAGCQRGVPMLSAGVTDVMQVIAKHVGINLTAYDFRRNYGDEIDNNYGESGASTGLTHSSMATYKANYGREAANLDNAGSVMHEATVDRHSLNTYESPAFNPSVGLSKADARKLEILEQGAGKFKINTMPPQLKRSSAAIIAPYGSAKVVVEAQSYDDAACEAHPAWQAFIQDTQWKARETQLAGLARIVDDALQKLPISTTSHGSRETQLQRGYPNNPEFMTAFLEHRRIHGIQTASRRKKMSAIRVLIAGTAEAAPTNVEDTYEARDARAAQFAEPSALLNVAIHHAPLSRLDTLSASLLAADSSSATSSSAATSSVSSPLATSSASSSSEQVSLDDLIDPNFRELDEGDPKDVDIDEVPASIVRAGYMRMLVICGQDAHTTCPKCEIDPTVGEVERSVEWTAFKLARHITQFHTVPMQCLRWCKKHGTCFLCALDGEPFKFGSRATYTRHINPTRGEHCADPRMPQEPLPCEIAVALPESFISPEVAGNQEEQWREIVDGIVLPSTFLNDVEMEEIVAAATTVSIDPASVTGGLDVPEVARMYKRLKLSKGGFVFVGAP
ncbi:hypothetical protein DFH09DRAFT_1287148 [Mycena vulgaris]|nr:hypothetical protein DFH09DRAFT_1287148 [Mycena vulgaris]